MSDIHQLTSLPKKPVIDLIQSYGTAFDREQYDYHQLLSKLQTTLIKNKFMDGQDNAAWMNHRGHDYLANPTLFEHAPLTYICAFLSEIFKHNSLKKIEQDIPPNVFRAILKRLAQFE